MMRLDEENLVLKLSSDRTQQSTTQDGDPWAKEGFAGRNGYVGRGHVDETKIRRGEELGDRRSCEEQRRLGEVAGRGQTYRKPQGSDCVCVCVFF